MNFHLYFSDIQAELRSFLEILIRGVALIIGGWSSMFYSIATLAIKTPPTIRPISRKIAGFCVCDNPPARKLFKRIASIFESSVLIEEKDSFKRSCEISRLVDKTSKRGISTEVLNSCDYSTEEFNLRLAELNATYVIFGEMDERAEMIVEHMQKRGSGTAVFVGSCKWMKTWLEGLRAKNDRVRIVQWFVTEKDAKIPESLKSLIFDTYEPVIIHPVNFENIFKDMNN